MGRNPDNPRNAESWRDRALLSGVAFALNLGAFSATALWVASAPSWVEALVLSGALWRYEHHRPCIWRRPSLLVGGILTAASVCYVLALLSSPFDSPFVTREHPWLLLVGILPAHLLAHLLDGLRPRVPVKIASGGGQRYRVGNALKAPFCRFHEDPKSNRVIDLPLKAPTELPRDLHVDGHRVRLWPQGPTEGMGWAVKRTFDLVFVMLFAPLIVPTLLVCAVLVRLTSRGPAFYSQERVTLDGQIFRIVKLRSMVTDAEQDGVPVWPKAHDDRITPLGRFLRRGWLDELPQFGNVLLGQMSVVSPRPERPPFVQEFRAKLPNYPLRHRARAGMTGLAQVAGLIGNTSLEHRLVYDLRYLRRWSPLLDLVICLKTGWMMIRRLSSRGLPPDERQPDDTHRRSPSSRSVS